LDERREFERITTAWPVSISMPGGGDHRAGTTLNVSASGVAVELDGEMLMAGNVQLLFGGEPPVEGIMCTARIVWVASGSTGLEDKARLGLHYLDMRAVDRSKLRFALYGSPTAKKRSDVEGTEAPQERRKA